MTAVLQVRSASRRFGDLEVLREVSVEARAGEVLGLIGPNGGGKSTLLLMMAGLVSPSAGEVTVDGTAATELALQATGQVGLVTAEPGLYPLMTGRENLHYFGGLFDLDAAEVDRRCQPLVEQLAVAPALDRPVGAMSSGMRQKFSLVRALLLSPRALLLDEPTANLDPVAAWTIYEAVREQADRGVAVVLCTHDLHAAESLCERVLLLRQTVLATHEQPGRRSAPPTGALLELYKRETG